MDTNVFVLVAIPLIIVAIILSISRSRQRYHGTGEGTDVRNIEEFGHPMKSLYTSSKVFTLHHRIEITDENENVVYRAETQFPSIHDKTDIYRADGSHVAHMERKIFTLHERRFIQMSSGVEFQLSNELFHLVRDVTNIEGLGWVLEGNLLQLNFTLKDASGNLIAVVGQKLFSIHDKYSLDIYQTEHEETAVAILVALQHMITDRAAASSGGGAASSGSSS
jgi:uncharacterized protein YxjI